MRRLCRTVAVAFRLGIKSKHLNGLFASSLRWTPASLTTTCSERRVKSCSPAFSGLWLRRDGRPAAARTSVRAPCCRRSGRSEGARVSAAPGEAPLGQCGRGGEVYESLCSLVRWLHRGSPVWLGGRSGPCLQPKSSEKTSPNLPKCFGGSWQENLEVEQGRCEGLEHLSHKPFGEADSGLKRLQKTRCCVRNRHRDAFDPICRPRGRTRPVRTCRFRVRRARACKDCNETRFSDGGVVALKLGTPFNFPSLPSREGRPSCRCSSAPSLRLTSGRCRDGERCAAAPSSLFGRHQPRSEKLT